VQKAPGSGDIQSIEKAAAGTGVGIEDCTPFSGLKLANLGQRKRDEVDGQFRIGDGEVSGDVVGIRTGGTPVALVLSRDRESTAQEQSGDPIRKNSFTHSLRMTFGAAPEQAEGAIPSLSKLLFHGPLPHPYSVKKMLVSLRLRGSMGDRVVSRLDLAAESSQERTYRPFSAKCHGGIISFGLGVGIHSFAVSQVLLSEAERFSKLL